VQYVALRIEDLAACPCGEHAVLRLTNAEGRPRARIRIAAEFARAIPAYDAGLVSGPATAVIALTDCMRAAGVEPTALVLSREGDDLRVCLRVESAGSELDLAIEAGVGFLAARHLELEILLASGPSTQAPATGIEAKSPVPEVYHAALDGLEWDVH
jgi:hypothetical protein